MLAGMYPPSGSTRTVAALMPLGLMVIRCLPLGWAWAGGTESRKQEYRAKPSQSGLAAPTPRPVHLEANLAASVNSEGDSPRVRRTGHAAWCGPGQQPAPRPAQTPGPSARGQHHRAPSAAAPPARLRSSPPASASDPSQSSPATGYPQAAGECRACTARSSRRNDRPACACAHEEPHLLPVAQRSSFTKGPLRQREQRVAQLCSALAEHCGGGSSIRLSRDHPLCSGAHAHCG